MQILISRGHEKIFTISHSISLIFGISIAFIIIPINNIIGASQLLIVTELIAMFLLAIGVHYSKNQS
jgi:O-antigen/teichoic acid export membrane protein